MKSKRKSRLAWLLTLTMLLSCAAFSTSGYAAQEDPVLRYQMTTADRTTELQSGDSIRVNVVMSRADKSTEAYPFYGAQLDIDYDNELFDVSELKTGGITRPDGQAWKAGWSCLKIAAPDGGTRIRVYGSNMALRPNTAGGVTNMDVISEPQLTVASFQLKVKDIGAKENSAVTFHFVESIGSDLGVAASETGEPLILTLKSDGSDQGENGSGQNTGGSGAAGGPSGGSSGGTQAGSAENKNENENENEVDSSSKGSTVKASFSEITDVSPEYWAAESIKFLIEKGIAVGNENKQFEPEKNVTRAEFCQMIVNAFEYQVKDSAIRFDDVPAGEWYFHPVMALNQAGIVSGIGDDLFGAGDALSRQDMAVMLYKIMKDQNIVLTAEREALSFQDEADIDDYAQLAVMDLYCTGIMSGTGEETFGPLENSTRAQVATVLKKIIEREERR